MIPERVKECQTVDDFVVQKYINNPLLYQGKKCHIRVPVIMTDKREWFVMDRLMIYTAVAPFIPGDMSKSVSDSHYKITEGSIVYRGSLRLGENDNEDPYYLPDEPIHDYRVRKEAIRVSKAIVQSVTNIIKFPECENAYHIFASDIIIDENYNAQLLEVNRTYGKVSNKRYSKLYWEWVKMSAIDPIFFPIIRKGMHEISQHLTQVTLTQLREHEGIGGAYSDVLGNMEFCYRGVVNTDEARYLGFMSIFPSPLLDVDDEYSCNERLIIQCEKVTDIPALLNNMKDRRMWVMCRSEKECEMFDWMMWMPVRKGMYLNYV